MTASLHLPSLAALRLVDVDARGDRLAAQRRASRRRPVYATRAHTRRPDRASHEVWMIDQEAEDRRIWEEYQRSIADARAPDECPICQGDLLHDPADPEHTLACGHTFHEHCLREMVTKVPSPAMARHCPICRKADPWLSQLVEERLAPTGHDRDDVLAAVAQNGLALQHASVALRNDRGVVLAAVAQSGLALQHASVALRDDRDVVLAAVTQYGRALRYASEALQDDRDVVLVAVALYGTALAYASVALRSDHDVVLAAVTQDGTALYHVLPAHEYDRVVVLAAVAQNGLVLAYASVALRNDHDVVIAAVAR